MTRWLAGSQGAAPFLPLHLLADQEPDQQAGRGRGGGGVALRVWSRGAAEYAAATCARPRPTGCPTPGAPLANVDVVAHHSHPSGTPSFGRPAVRIATPERALKVGCGAQGTCTAPRKLFLHPADPRAPWIKRAPWPRWVNHRPDHRAGAASACQARPAAARGRFWVSRSRFARAQGGVTRRAAPRGGRRAPAPRALRARPCLMAAAAALAGRAPTRLTTHSSTTDSRAPAAPQPNARARGAAPVTPAPTW